MAKKSTNQIQGIILVIAGALVLVDIPVINGESTLGGIAALAVGIWNLTRK